MNFFIVNFDKAASNEMCFRCVIFSYCYYLTECPRNDSFGLLALSSHHGVRFAAACLPIRKNGAIIAIEYIFDQREGTLLVDETL